MRDLKLTNRHDLAVENGDMAFVDNAEEILQAIRIRLLAIQTESVYDFTMGPPWLDEMFDPQVPKVVKEGYLKQIIIDTPGVLRIEKFLLNIDFENNGVVIESECRILGETVPVSISIEV